ncbi:MAG: GHMP kinase [Chloroflexota bacterium]
MTIPGSVIHASAPIRICDLGGWTDTWFARHGKVLHLAVSPFVEVQIALVPRGTQPKPVLLDVKNYGDRYCFDPKNDARHKHPLLEAAIARIGIPEAFDCEIGITSQAPSGGATGTSAAVCVALIGALDCLTPERLTPAQVAREAFNVETEMLGMQSGIQDQIASAYGGINFIEMDSFPEAKVTQLDLPQQFLGALENQISLIYLGKPHSSSDVHGKVIKALEASGTDNPQLQRLSEAAQSGRDALIAGDLIAYGQTMAANTTAQATLHPDLVSPEAQQVIEIAKAYGALGWKVNGAGGVGGSVTLLSGPDPQGKEAMVSAIMQASSAFQVIPIQLSPRGLICWESNVESN